MTFKSHDLPQPHYRRVINVVRDGRDAMCSYFHFNKALIKNVTLKEMVVDGEGLFPCRWHEHISAWQSNPYNAELITVRYEDLMRDGVREASRIASFVEAETSTEEIKKVYESCKFARIRASEKKFGLPNPNWPKDENFTRRGIIGDYKNEFPTNLLDIFQRDSRTELESLGYLCGE